MRSLRVESLPSNRTVCEGQCRALGRGASPSGRRAGGPGVLLRAGGPMQQPYKALLSTGSRSSTVSSGRPPPNLLPRSPLLGKCPAANPSLQRVRSCPVPFTGLCVGVGPWKDSAHAELGSGFHATWWQRGRMPRTLAVFQDDTGSSCTWTLVFSPSRAFQLLCPGWISHHQGRSSVKHSGSVPPSGDSPRSWGHSTEWGTLVMIHSVQFHVVPNSRTAEPSTYPEMHV